MKKEIQFTFFGVFIVAAIVIAVVLFWYKGSSGDDRLKINEIAFNMASGNDWIEIYNPGIRSISLKGMYLSDDEGNLTRFEIIDSLVIGPGGFIIIQGEGYEGEVTNGTIANFRIKEGETVYLVAPDGTTVIDSVSALLDNDRDDATLGRYPDGGLDFYIMTEYTPGEPNIRSEYLVAATSYNVPEYDQIFGFNEVREFHFTISEEDLQTMEPAEGNAQDNQDPAYVAADVVFDGVGLSSVAIRYKGNSSLYSNKTTKKSYRVDFNKYVDGQTLYGLEEIVLNCNFKDPSQLREALAYDLFDEVDVPAGLVGFAEVYVNDEYIGLYTMVENVDEQYLEHYFGNSDGDLFKAGNGATLEYLGEDELLYTEQYEHKEVNDELGMSAFIDFLEVLNSEVDETYPDRIQEVLDVYEVLDYLAMNFVQTNMDSYPISGHNYYIYFDTDEDRYKILPWDVNEAFGNFSGYEQNINWNLFDQAASARSLGEGQMKKQASGVSDQQRPLFTQLYAVDEYQAYYIKRVAYYTNQVFTVDNLSSRIMAWHELITDSVLAQTREASQYTEEEFLTSIYKDVADNTPLREDLVDKVGFRFQPAMSSQGLIPFIEERTAAILGQLKAGL